MRQSNRDRAEQAAQANYLAQSTSTVSHMESVQAQVTGQLARQWPDRTQRWGKPLPPRWDSAEGDGTEVRRGDPITIETSCTTVESCTGLLVPRSSTFP